MSTFNPSTFQYARQVRLLADACLETSGGDDAEAAIDSVVDPVAFAAVQAGADPVTAGMLGRWWALELFYGYDADGKDPATGEPRYLDAPDYTAACANAAQWVLDSAAAVDCAYDPEEAAILEEIAAQD